MALPEHLEQALTLLRDDLKRVDRKMRILEELFQEEMGIFRVERAKLQQNIAQIEDVAKRMNAVLELLEIRLESP